MAYKRYIDAVGLAEVIENLDIRVAGKPARWNDVKYSVLREISQAPDADVEEVKHGEWIDDGFGRGNMICSVCKQYPAEDENGNPLSALANWEPEICPICGAKMDGGKAE